MHSVFASLCCAALLAGASAQLNSSASTCNPHNSCTECLADTTGQCGWCSTPVVYPSGATGTRCEGPAATSGDWHCDGIYSTDSCEAGYKCSEAPDYQCVIAAPGEGVKKDKCELDCKAPAGVFYCDTSDLTCKPCPAVRPPGIVCESMEVCEKSITSGTCGQSPAADVYVCNDETFTCDKASPGTPGSASKEVCENSCFDPKDPCMQYSTKCETCLQHTDIGCGWCSSLVKYQNISSGSGFVGGHCAGVGPGIAKFVCAGEYSVDGCGAHGNCSANIDIMYAIDASCSINEKNDWPIEKTIVQNFAKSFTFGGGGAEGEFARQGITYFSNGAKTPIAGGLTGSETTFIDAVNAMEYGYKGCHTKTGDAMQQVYTALTGAPRPKTDARITVLLTDGAPTDHQQPAAVSWSNKIKQLSDSKVYAIAIGKGSTGSNLKNIEAIASTPASKYVFTSDSWKDALALVEKIINDICPDEVLALQ